MASLVFNTVKTPDGRPVSAKIEVRLIAGPSLDEPGWIESTQIEILSVWASQTNDSGYWAVELEPNSSIEPTGTYYKVTERYPPGNRATTYYIQVPDGATPQYWVGDILVQDPQAIVSSLSADKVSFTPSGTVVSTTVQAAIEELAGKIISGSGDAHYVHTQSSSSATWTITHGLGKYPSVTIVDSAGTEVEGDVQFVDINTVMITFSSGFSGKAYIN